jgi:hypothetical protein
LVSASKCTSRIDEGGRGGIQRSSAHTSNWVPPSILLTRPCRGISFRFDASCADCQILFIDWIALSLLVQSGKVLTRLLTSPAVASKRPSALRRTFGCLVAGLLAGVLFTRAKMMG